MLAISSRSSCAACGTAAALDDDNDDVEADDDAIADDATDDDADDADGSDLAPPDGFSFGSASRPATSTPKMPV